jgi:hypothetical protein
LSARITIRKRAGIITIVILSIIIASSSLGFSSRRLSGLGSKANCIVSKDGLGAAASVYYRLISQLNSKIKLSSLQFIDALKEGNLTGGSFTTMTKNIGNSISNDYVFSQNKSELSTPNNNDHTGDFGNGYRIAVVKPTFTTAAYANNFYTFYAKYNKVPKYTNVTTDLDMLSAKVTDCGGASASAMLFLVGQLKWVIPGASITTLTDEEVDTGKIFAKKGDNAYDVIILGHQEYVTQQEYNNLKHFVANGGTMIIMDGNVFYVEVAYDKATRTITLVKGHGWAYNGKSAWRSMGERWAEETEQWVGSNYLCYSCEITFANNPFGYRHHEEQYLTNPDDLILLNFNATIQSNSETSSMSDKNDSDKQFVIATYELNYQKGKVIALGIYSDDIISEGSFDRYLDSLVLKYALRTKAVSM